MKQIKVAAAALNQTPLDWDGNQRRIVEVIKAARAHEVSALCLPELCITGYGCEDAFQSMAVLKTAWQMYETILPHTKGMVVTLGLPLFLEGDIYNASMLLVNQQLAGIVLKQNLAGDGLHYEPRWFKAWQPGDHTLMTLDDGTQVPVGDLVFDVDGVRLGFEICEDAWVARRAGISLAARHVDVILNPSSSHFAFGKHEVRKQLVCEGSRAFGAVYLYSNLLGNEAGRAIYDGDAYIASLGQVVASNPRFQFGDWTLTQAAVDVDLNRALRARVVSRMARVIDDGHVTVGAFTWPTEVIAEKTPELQPEIESKEAEFTRAIALALFDYLRKAHARGFVVSLSGGADSTAVVCLVRLMVDLGVNELGAEAFCRRIGIEVVAEPDEITGALLTTVYQATRNSSDTTREAAREVADHIGAKHLELDVDEIGQQYVQMISSALKQPIDWEHHDIPLQNIQARIRAPGAWLIANCENKILLSTSNRSEAAVGYATMDGDTAGGISPVAGIDKVFLRKWLKWLEVEGLEGVGSIGAIGPVTPIARMPVLGCVNRQKPTAELRPQAAVQTDEDDLMPYEILDFIEEQAIGYKRSPAETFHALKAHFTVDDRQLFQWVRRFFVLWCQNQWKRERYAPSFHVDDLNLDPKTWCRFPILSGGFQRELDALASELGG